MQQFKRLASTLCAATFLAVLGLLVTSSHSAPTSDTIDASCPSCAKKIQIKQTGDPDKDLAALNQAMKQFEASQILHRAKERASRQANYETWQGTQLFIKDTVQEDALALHEEARKAFSADPAAPAGRKEHFRRWLAPDSQIRCVGYFGTIESVTPNANGKLVVINILPRLANKDGGVPYTPTTAVEAWQLGDDGTLKNLKSMPNPKRPTLLMTD